MGLGDWLRDNIDYSKELLETGIEGASSELRTLDQESVSAELAQALETSWRHAVLGACVGTIVGFFSDDRRRGRGAVVGAFFGGALGFTGGVAWGSRRLTGTVARGAMKNINAARDARWLEKNPVTYA